MLFRKCKRLCDVLCQRSSAESVLRSGSSFFAHVWSFLFLYLWFSLFLLIIMLILVFVNFVFTYIPLCFPCALFPVRVSYFPQYLFLSSAPPTYTCSPSTSGSSVSNLLISSIISPSLCASCPVWLYFMSPSSFLLFACSCCCLTKSF